MIQFYTCFFWAALGASMTLIYPEGHYEVFAAVWGTLTLASAILYRGRRGE